MLAHDIDSGIVGKVLLRSFDILAAPAVEALASRENELGKKISGGAISKDVPVDNVNSIQFTSYKIRIAS